MSLINTNNLPPGGWVFSQNDAAGHLLKTFQSMSPFNDAASEILSFRIANKLPRATIAEVKEDLDLEQCVRLGQSEKFCTQKKTLQAMRVFRQGNPAAKASVEAAVIEFNASTPAI